MHDDPDVCPGAPDRWYTYLIVPSTFDGDGAHTPTVHAVCAYVG
ncbi:MAG TPA: hypothetical protein VLA98_16345 [Solirubrobacteraceae bacterium]|nr:hypothetical protein [Solirubrobacteraceae bacterium]